MNCIGCSTTLKDDNHLKCNFCKSKYCLKCLNLGKGDISSISSETMSSLKCPSCLHVNAGRRKRDENSPARQAQQVPSFIKANTSSTTASLSLESIDNLLSQKLILTTTELRTSLIQDFKALIASELSNAVSSLKEEFTKTTDFLMDEVKTLKENLKQTECAFKELQSECTNLKATVYVLEKMSRERNLEIQAVPECPNENVNAIFKSLCTKLECPVAEVNILAVRRVAKFDPASKRPRNILVTLASPRLRDDLISAASRFNKKHSSDKLSSNHIEVPGESRRIYLNEHLSPETKQLYAATRAFARERGYAFAWVKFGQIFLRRDEKSKAVIIKTKDFLKTIV